MVKKERVELRESIILYMSQVNCFLMKNLSLLIANKCDKIISVCYNILQISFHDLSVSRRKRTKTGAEAVWPE